MNEYADDLVVEEGTLDKCNFNLIDEKLIQFGSGYLLSPQIKEAEDEEDEKLVKLYKILQKTCELKLKPSSTNEPYSLQSKETLSNIFSRNDLDVLAQIIPRVNCQAFRARLHDLCWLYCKPRSIHDAYKTIELYISYSIDSDTWLDGVQDYYERALSLALQLGKGALTKVNVIKNRLLDALKLVYQDSKFMRLWIARLLSKLNLSREEVEHIANDFVLVAQNLTSNNDYNTARHYLEYAAKSYLLIEEKKARINTLINIAETWELEALSREQALIRMTLYENAIQAYRYVPKVNREYHGVNAKISDLRLKLRDAGKAAISEIPTFSIKSPDIRDIVESAIDHVSSKENLDLALLFFCGLYSGVSKSCAINSAMETMKFGLAARLVGSIQLSGDGRKIGQEKPAAFTPDEIPEETPMFQAVEAAVRNAGFFVKSQLLPALNIISNEHQISLSKLESLCASCPLIPENRTKLFAKGLFFGFEYDFDTAVHLLLPQWENMVRTVLKESNVHTTTLGEDGVDMECGLSTLLDKDEAAEIFDDDLLFQMKAFLTHKRGPNLRNEIAHGLLDDNDTTNTSSVYWWWRSLKFVIYSLVKLPCAEKNEDL